MNRYENAVDKVARYCSDAKTGCPRFYETDIRNELTILQELAEQQEIPTFEECIKEWENRGFEVVVGLSSIKLYFKESKEEILLWNDKTYRTDMWLNFEENQLITKTFKAWEVEN